MTNFETSNKLTSLNRAQTEKKKLKSFRPKSKLVLHKNCKNVCFSASETFSTTWNKLAFLPKKSSICFFLSHFASLILFLSWKKSFLVLGLDYQGETENVSFFVFSLLLPKLKTMYIPSLLKQNHSKFSLSLMCAVVHTLYNLNLIKQLKCSWNMYRS